MKLHNRIFDTGRICKIRGLCPHNLKWCVFRYSHHRKLKEISDGNTNMYKLNRARRTPSSCKTHKITNDWLHLVRVEWTKQHPQNNMQPPKAKVRQCHSLWCSGVNTTKRCTCAVLHKYKYISFLQLSICTYITILFQFNNNSFYWNVASLWKISLHILLNCLVL